MRESSRSPLLLISERALGGDRGLPCSSFCSRNRQLQLSPASPLASTSLAALPPLSGGVPSSSFSLGIDYTTNRFFKIDSLPTINKTQRRPQPHKEKALNCPRRYWTRVERSGTSLRVVDQERTKETSSPLLPPNSFSSSPS
ncbi:hypothetical protein MUK42_29650 [Musa troglodytarum]|uniref:Uncharacterized protein n=1 Tax=Musa troglodytarum TaxID=320322 RepID=A0A9E7FBS7_9LILI|nr:hypothetical protein MUK42_29650 [Musa troglodytarum]